MYAKRAVRILLFFLPVAWAFTAFAQHTESKTGKSAGELVELKWYINDTLRKALAYIPLSAQTRPTPLIFAFHGHSGTMYNMHRTHPFEQLWPEALIIYPQGLNTPGALTDPQGKAPGWQAGNSMGNRDLKFFDAMLDSLAKNYSIDQRRIYATGHSNGGNFVYLLWAQRGNIFAAMAPTSTVPGRNLRDLQPKPVFHLTGEKDPLVKPEKQYLTHQWLLKLNKCDLQGEKRGEYLTVYQSSINMPVELYIHPGGHEYPKAANEAIIRFFKQQQKN